MKQSEMGNIYHDFNQGSFILSVEANRDCSGYQIHKSSLLLEDISALPERWAGHTVTTYNVDGGTTKILLFGGQTSHHRYLNDVYTADCTNYTPSHILHNPPARVKITWKLVQCSGSYPRPRHCHSAVYLEKNRRILIFGGWAGPHEFLNDVHLLDVDVFSWSRVNTEGVPPCPRCQTNIFLVPPVQAKPEFATSGGYLLVYGGACHYAVCDVTYDRWEPLFTYVVLALHVYYLGAMNRFFINQAK